MAQPRIVTAAVIVRDGLVLVMRRAPGEKLAGSWEFPGGKVEAGESPEACLRRELREELGIEGVTEEHLCDSLYQYPSGSILLRAYRFRWVSGDITLSVHDKMLWLEPAELTSIKLAPADIAVAKAVEDYLSNV